MQVNHQSAQSPEIYLNILIVSKAERFSFPFGACKTQVGLNVIGRKKKTLLVVLITKMGNLLGPLTLYPLGHTSLFESFPQSSISVSLTPTKCPSLLPSSVPLLLYTVA